ncbi:tumor necrosis factor ligand superfamily member 11 [Puntigrus tetrazona]|uniref:tumor necrosis factor ligand superfamily member 11 n=1 Tax=Puntigrus tetrazona TaxID=1606681 RepID=UPI001C8ADF08|nr:tumor necrosis factor ligand superfamily member 11 [Puntigrus tetrazona]
MAANDYRAYLRNHIDMEEAPGRAAHTGPTHRALIFGTLAVMGLLQVASSVAILLHLTGYLREVDLASAQQSPNEEMHSETLIADPACKSFKEKNQKCRLKKDTRMPLAHLPIKTPTNFSAKNRNDLTMITWDESQGLKYKTRHNAGRILVEEAGYYYVYAKTCFRYAEDHDSSKEDVSNLQLFQYIYHEKHTQSVITPILLTKSGGTLQWNIAKFNMYCVEQGRSIQLSNADGIYVNVSNAWLLDPAADGTYFGAFKISN